MTEVCAHRKSVNGFIFYLTIIIKYWPYAGIVPNTSHALP